MITRIIITLAKQRKNYDTSTLTTIESNATLFSSGFLKSDFILLEKALEDYGFKVAQIVIERMHAGLTSKNYKHS